MIEPGRGEDVTGEPPETSHGVLDRGRAGSRRARRGRPVATGPVGGGEVRPRRWASLRDLPVRGKLFAALAVPTAAFLALGILLGVTWLSNAASYGRDVTAAKLGRDVTATVHELQLERDLAVGYISSGRGADSETALTGRLDSQQRAVDATMARFRGTLGSSVGGLGAGTGRVADRAEGDIGGLPALRRSVRTGGLPMDAIFSQYSTMITNLLDLDGRIGQDRDDEDLRYAATVLGDVSALKEIDSEIRGQLFATSFAQRFAFGASDRLAGLLAQEQTAQDAFRSAARPDDRARFDQIVNGQAVLTVKRISERAIQRQRLTDLDIDPDQWLAASTTHIELLRIVESDLLANVTHSAEHLRSAAWQRIALIGTLILVITVGAVVWTLAIARTMTAPLRRLRSGALDVAQVRLPRLISELHTVSPEQVDTTIQPIGIDSRDEIGEVARTFDELQREAVRLAAEQASLRRNVNTLFLSLSRRSQSLIERQIALIDRLEAAEENPLQLENLFRLDHLATRMRRNSENLLVLAGTGPGRRRAEPVPLGDVLQAALGEIEQYERVQIVDVPDARVAADSVNHVVHLVAELLENAAQFSPPYLSVDLAATADDGGVLITIDDGGLGMSERELAAVNQRLADPPTFDFSIAQRLGLFVVARLADRHDIEVRLSRSDAGGVRASVRLPAALLVASDPVPVPVPVSVPVSVHGLVGAPKQAEAAAEVAAPGADVAGSGGFDGGPDAAAPVAPVFAPYVPTSGWFRPRGIGLTDDDLADLADLVDLADLDGVDRPTGSDPTGPGALPAAGGDADLPSIAQAVAALDRRRERAATRRERAVAARPDPSATGDAASPAAGQPAWAAFTSPTAGLRAFSENAAGTRALDGPAGPFNWFVREELPAAPGQANGPAGRPNGPDGSGSERVAVGLAAVDVAGSRGGSVAAGGPFTVPGLPAVPKPVVASTPRLSSRSAAGPLPATASGLPIRTPNSVPIPGQIPPGPPTGPVDGAASPSLFLGSAGSASSLDLQVAPERIRGRLSRLYEGIHHARGTGVAAAEDDAVGD